MRRFFGKWKGLWLLLTVVFTLIFVFAVVVGALLEANSAQVDRYLGTTSWTVSSGVSEDDVYTAYTPKYENSDALKQEHIDVGTRVGAEGSVLLQNTDDALPISKSDKVTLFGIASTKTGGYYGMNMGGPVNDDQNVSLFEALTDRGVDVNEDMSDYYEEKADSASRSTNNKLATSNDTIDSASLYVPYEAETDSTKVGSYTDVGIIVVGRYGTESGDYFPGRLGINDMDTGARNVLALTDDEKAMIKVAKDTCDKVVVLVNSCNAMELGDIMPGGDYAVNAIMWIAFPGNYGYYGVADVLLGESPSGHLTDTFAMNTTSAPAMQNFGVYKFTNGDDVDDESIDESGNYGSYYLVEAESIYTGYKYYETRYEDAVMGDEAAASDAGAFEPIEGQSVDSWKYDEQVAFSFGYGLSYTTFDQTITSVDWSDDMREATVNVTVTNTGEVAGRSVVQVYGQSPYTEYDEKNGVEKASVQLLNYGKTEEIPANGSTTISIPVELQYLASYDTDGEGTYIMEASENYYFALGCNSDCEGSHAAVNNILAAKGFTKGNNDVLDSNGDADATYKFTWDESNADLFSVSKEGVEITNQLEEADLNYWNCGTKVTYLSRSDWEWKDETGETNWNTTRWRSGHLKGYTDVTATDEMIAKLRNDTYEVHTDDDVSDILFDQPNGMTFADMYSLDKDEEGNVLGVTVVDYDDPLWDELLDELNLEEAITFISQGNRNYSSLSGINFVGGTYTENGPTGIQSVISTGYEAPWSDSNDPNKSYSWNDIGAAPLQAATFDHELLEEIGEMWGNDSLFVNLPVLWAPSINTHRTQYNGRNAEYYSEDGILSGYSANDVGAGAQRYGLIVAIKHFAFNDQESNRCGVAVFMTEQQARENELRGFQIALEGDVKGIMTAYNRLGCTWASANEGLMKGILRGEWDYNGYAVSDNASTSDYMTFTEGVYAGTTNFDVTTMNWGSATDLATLYANDAQMLQAIKDSVHSTLWTFANSNMANYMTSDASQVWVANWWRVTYITLEVVFGVLALAAIAFYVVGEVLGKDGDDDDKKEDER